MAWYDDWLPPSRKNFNELEKRVATIEEKLQTVIDDQGKIKAAVGNILEDEKRQDAKIKELEEALAAGPQISPAAQALLDQVVTLSSGNTTSVQALADSIPEPPTT